MKDIKAITQKAENELRKRGVDAAHIAVASRVTHEFNIANGEFSLFRTLFDDSLALTAFKDNKKGSVGINKLDDVSIENAVADCVKSAESGVADECYGIAPKQENKTFSNRAYEGDIDTFFARSKELLETIKANYPKIKLSDTVFSHVKVDKVYRNTNGTQADTHSGYYSVSLGFSGLDGEKTTSMNEASFSTLDLDTPFIEMSDIKKQLDDTVKQLDMRAFSGKIDDGIVMLSPACVAQFLGDILSNFVSGAVIRDKTSIWLDKLNKQVADPRLTVRFSTDDPRLVAPQKYTGDGFLAESYNLIENGVLKCFCLDLFNANKTGYERAKNTDTDVIIEGGTASYEDMIKGIKKGLIVGYFAGGQPGTNGDFSGVAKNSFYVEDGKILYPVNEVMINGNLASLLMNIKDISKEVVIDGDGVLPYISVGGVVISGK